MDTQPTQQEGAATVGEIDLQPFCGTCKHRPAIRLPFSHREWTYATDGAILLRVARRSHPLCAEGLKPPSWENVEGLLAAFPHEAMPVEIGELPETLWRERECAWCQGVDDDCEECDGAGKLIVDIGHDVAGVSFAARYLALVKALPDVRFYLPVYRAETSPHAATFYFTGGCGVLMPRREINP